MKSLILGLLALSLLTGCQESPTGRNQLALVPDVVMADIGQQTFSEMKQQLPVLEDPDINRLARCIAQELVQAAATEYPSAPIPESWEVVVFRNDTPNAFALPGGKIGIHTGLLEVAQNSAQLAAVIGHEVAHVLADHGNERLTQELGLKAALLLVGLFTESEIAEDQLQNALGIGAQLGITLPFSRAHESEADLMGLTIMARAGFDPEQSVALWRNMARASGEQPLEFLSTHPNHDTRIADLSARMESANQLFRVAVPADCNL